MAVAGVVAAAAGGHHGQQQQSLGGKKLDLEMIYEEEAAANVEDMIDDLGQNDQDCSSSQEKYHRATLMMKRSRSLPQEEFAYLTQKLKELGRADSIISGTGSR